MVFHYNEFSLHRKDERTACKRRFQRKTREIRIKYNPAFGRFEEGMETSSIMDWAEVGKNAPLLFWK